MSSVCVYRNPRQFTAESYFDQLGLLQHDVLVYINATFSDGELRPEGRRQTGEEWHEQCPL